MKNPISYIVQRWFPKIAEINRKYSHPRLVMSPLVQRVLLSLRLYLLFLVALLAYKFITLL
jgi:hypothetical protein